jgi:hypothetical protein
MDNAALKSILYGILRKRALVALPVLARATVLWRGVKQSKLMWVIGTRIVFGSVYI